MGSHRMQSDLIMLGAVELSCIDLALIRRGLHAEPMATHFARFVAALDERVIDIRVLSGEARGAVLRCLRILIPEVRVFSAAAVALLVGHQYLVLGGQRSVR